MWIGKTDVKHDDNYDTDIVMEKICDTKKNQQRDASGNTGFSLKFSSVHRFFQSRRWWVQKTYSLEGYRDILLS